MFLNVTHFFTSTPARDIYNMVQNAVHMGTRIFSLQGHIFSDRHFCLSLEIVIIMKCAVSIVRTVIGLQQIISRYYASSWQQVLTQQGRQAKPC